MELSWDQIARVISLADDLRRRRGPAGAEGENFETGPPFSRDYSLFSASRAELKGLLESMNARQLSTLRVIARRGESKTSPASLEEFEREAPAEAFAGEAQLVDRLMTDDHLAENLARGIALVKPLYDAV